MKFLSDCSHLRVNSDGENLWRSLMNSKEEISKEEFENSVEKQAIEALLDEGETIEDFMISDLTSYFAKSIVNNQTYYFIGTCGFEFFFGEKYIFETKG